MRQRPFAQLPIYSGKFTLGHQTKLKHFHNIKRRQYVITPPTIEITQLHCFRMGTLCHRVEAKEQGCTVCQERMDMLETGLQGSEFPRHPASEEACPNA